MQQSVMGTDFGIWDGSAAITNSKAEALTLEPAGAEQDPVKAQREARKIALAAGRKRTLGCSGRKPVL